MPNKDEQARKLADIHYEIEPEMRQIFRLVSGKKAESKEDEPIKLLEVNDGTIAAGIMPLWFGPVPNRGFHYPVVVVEITPEEFSKLQKKVLKLPRGWRVGELFPKRTANGEE